MKREYLKKLAIDSGFDVVGAQGFLVAAGLEGTQDHKLRKLISLVEQATLERAAQEFEVEWRNEVISAEMCADIVRALKDSND